MVLQTVFHTEEPYLGKGSSKHKGLVTHCVPAAPAVRPTNGGPVNGGACGPSEDDCSCASVVHYNSSTGTLVLSFAGSKAVLEDLQLGQTDGQGPDLAPPDFLRAAAPAAMVNAALLKGEATDVIDRSLKAVEEVLPSGSQPNSILCTGYGTGGALAAVIVTRLALKYPTADTSCIAFGSPFMCNKEYAEAFNLLVGLSFRVSCKGDPIVSQPQHGPWTFPATWDVQCSPEGDQGGTQLSKHMFSTYLQAVLTLGKTCSLPKNGPGVYLLLRPDVITHDKQQDPWPVDDSFVPTDRNAPGLKSPYEALVQLGDGQRHSVEELFSSDSDAWRKVVAELGNKLGDLGKLDDMKSMQGLHTSKRVGHSRSAKTRFVPNQSPAHGLLDPTGMQAKNNDQVASAVAGQTKTDKTDRLEYLSYKLEDLAYNSRATDVVAAYRLALPMLLAQAAYRTSSTSTIGNPTIAPAAGNEEEVFNDPFGGGVRDIKNLILGYRLVDDCDFRYNGKSLDQKQKMPDGNKTDTQAYVLWLKNGTAVFAFRGTSNMSDWSSNLDFAKGVLGDEEDPPPNAHASSATNDGSVKNQSTHKPGMRGTVHRGFMRGFCAVAYRGEGEPNMSAYNLAGALKELMHLYPVPGLDPEQGPARVMCVGHSLGGALATVCAVWAPEQYPLAPVSLYTFGQPRVGNDEFVAHLNSVVGYTARVVHRLDVVPLVPLNRQGFQHYYPAGYLGCSAGDRLTALFRVLPRRCHFFLRYLPDSRWGFVLPTLVVGVGDHFMDSYHACFKTAMNVLGLRAA
ncbi:hypothetical protein N2152v2_008611 [Parachlorella kessleri]